MIHGVGEVDSSVGGRGDALRAVQQGGRCRGAIAGEVAAAGHGGDTAAGGHHADSLVIGVGDIEVVQGVGGHSGDAREARQAGTVTVAGEAFVAVTGIRLQGSGGCNAADAVGHEIEDIDVAGGIGGHRSGDEIGGGGEAAIGGTAADPASGDGLDGVIHRDLTHPVVIVIVDINVALGIQCNIPRQVEEGAGCRTVIAGETFAASGDGLHDAIQG